nr:RNA-directed DNA polymerase, eukaryota, reverse transcriptase zinc-binding domain protein [Tanacetum cinerariifolium]
MTWHHLIGLEIKYGAPTQFIFNLRHSCSYVLASKEIGDFGVSSFYVLNRALTFKWIWWFQTHDSSLWSRVIKSIHGEDGKIGNSFKSGIVSNWNNISRGDTLLHNKGIDLLGYIKKKTGNGENTLFWGEAWKGDVPFSLLYPRIYALESCKSITVANKMAHSILVSSLRRNPRGGIEEVQMANLLSNLEGFTLSNMHDRWQWSLSGDGEFSLNLSRRGLDLDTISCPSCNLAVESTNHIFFGCSMAKDQYKYIARWWDVSMMTFSSYDELWNWFSNLRVLSKLKMTFEGVFYIFWWVIWNYRNKVIFGPSYQPKDRLLDDIVALSFTLCRSRCKVDSVALEFKAIDIWCDKERDKVITPTAILMKRIVPQP